MAVGVFNWRSRRARYARIGHKLSPFMPWLEVAAVLLLIGGAALVVIGLAAGWAVAGLAAIPVMIVQWYHFELRDVPVEKDSKTIDGTLDSELLALLPEQPSPKDIALALLQVPGGHFFEGRLGIGGNFLKEVAPDSREQTEAIFTEALSIAQKYNVGVSPGVMILAMLRQIPTRDTLLGHLQLGEDDIVRGIQWYDHLLRRIEADSHRQKLPGGIGRDWSFGWIPLLSRFGRNISQSGTMARGDIRIEPLQQLLNAFASGEGSVALVGKMGVGKSELVYQFADTIMHPTDDIPEKLHYKQVFMVDASRLLSATNGGGIEGLIESLLSEAYAAKNIVICLDNAELFFQEGVGSVDLTSLLLPIIEAGRLSLLLTLDEQKFLEISRRTPALAAAITKIAVHPTDEAETLKVLEDHVPIIEHHRKVTFMYQALKEAYKLSQRYVYDVSMPGQAISLLESACDYAEEHGLVTIRSVQRAVEGTTGVKTGIAADDAGEREKLLNLEVLIHERMIGQERAVGVVSDALRRARSGVRNQGRPVGTFLFLGPTGVGKTELAKSLASVYFGGEQNIIRLDMNEYVSSDDVARLIADGADDQNSLTAQVMKRPFSVVLLDEIEKAHSSVLTTFLQLLDEGVLRDVRNREVSFRDTIVIATSNAGAERIQELVQRGYSLEQFEETFISDLISSHIFHPEFLNRFDEMVVFGPLDKSQLLKVVDLILVDVNKNVAEQKITITVTPEAKEFLVEAGYDPRLGARPMRRVVQRAVENTVAKLLLAGDVSPGGSIEITLEQVQQIIGSKQQADAIIAENTVALGATEIK